MRAGFCTVVCLSLLCLPAVALAAAPCERLIATADGHSPPYLWPDPQHSGKFLGAHVELVKQLSSELQLPIKLLDSGSWLAAQHDVQSGRVDLLFGAFFDLPGNQQLDYLQPATWPLQLTSAHLDPLAVLVPAGQSDSSPRSVQSPEQYLALGRNSACNTPLLRGQLSKKLAELRASGQLDRLLQANLQRWQAQQQKMLPVLDVPNP
jgi:ABC-type amino acid transport substrate-binding protein